MTRPLACSFCGKDESQVQRLIAGPSVFICDGCVEICNDILAENPPPTTGVAGEPGARRRTRPWWRRLLDRFHASTSRAPRPEPSRA